MSTDSYIEKGDSFFKKFATSNVNLMQKNQTSLLPLQCLYVRKQDADFLLPALLHSKESPFTPHTIYCSALRQRWKHLFN